MAPWPTQSAGPMEVFRSPADILSWRPTKPSYIVSGGGSGMGSDPGGTSVGGGKPSGSWIGGGDGIPGGVTGSGICTSNIIRLLTNDTAQYLASKRKQAGLVSESGLSFCPGRLKVRTS